MGYDINEHKKETSGRSHKDNLVKLFVNKKNEIGFWNAIKLALKFV